MTAELALDGAAAAAAKPIIKAEATRIATAAATVAPAPAPAAKGTKRPRTPPKMDPRLAALRKMWRAAGITPAAAAGLKGLPIADAVDKFSAALKAAGAVFEGTVPTAAEIAAAKASRARAQDLEGLDTANVLGSGKKRRRKGRGSPAKGAGVPSPAAPPAAAAGSDGGSGSGSGGDDGSLFSEEESD